MQIKDFPNINTLADSDLVLIQTASDGAYKNILVSDLKNIFVSSANNSGTGTGTTKTAVTLTYVSDGDANGLFYYLGTKGYKQFWQNPATIAECLSSMSSCYDSLNCHPEYLTDRQPSAYIATQNVVGSSYQIYIDNYTIIPNYYSIRARDYPYNNPTGWILKGSLTSADWDTIDTVSNMPLSQNQWVSRPLTGNKNYRFFQIVENGSSTSGDNIFCIGEFEIYGKVTPV